MTYLDGSSLDSALTSLAAAAGVQVADLAAAVRGHNESRIEGNPDEPPWWQIQRAVFARLGVDVDALHFEGAYYFHGTRVVDPAAFWSRGILPLDQVIEEIWATLYALVADERTAQEWNAFRESVENDGGGDWGSLYRMKTRARAHFGPHGAFVRDVLLKPVPPAHDYLGNPEIVEDIARCYARPYGTDLEVRFQGATRPCIVTFSSDHVEQAAVNSVFWLAYYLLRNVPVGMNANGGNAMDGEPVPPERIVAVDLAEPVPGMERLYCLL